MVCLLLNCGAGDGRKMRHEDKTTELIVEKAYEESPGELSSKHPMVLSCGGIYIPYNKRKRMERPLWHVLNIADDTRLVKVVSSGLPRSPLSEILDKESKN